MQIVILSARTGWHTDELCRALAERGHIGVVLPYEGLVAAAGVGRVEQSAVGLSSEQAADPHRRCRARTHHSQRIARADHLSRRRAALDRGARRARDEFAARDRTVGRQVLYGRAAPGGGAADAGDGRLRNRRERDGSGARDAWASSRAQTRHERCRRHQADLRLDGTRAGARQRSGRRVSRDRSRSSRSGRSSTCSARSIMAAATSASSSSADG